jgi:cytidylate kinase
MKVAIYGQSCVGKTTLCDELASLLGGKAWHCGENLKQRAISDNCQVSDLPLDVHRESDRLTRESATHSSETLVIEGVFLDCVLAEVKDCVFIKLTCSDEERVRRHGLRKSRSNLDLRDESDQHLRARLFAGMGCANPDLELETTKTNALDLARRVSEWLGTSTT